MAYLVQYLIICPRKRALVGPESPSSLHNSLQIFTQIHLALLSQVDDTLYIKTNNTLTTEHSASSHSQPVLVDVTTGSAFGAADVVRSDGIFPKTAAEIVASDLPHQLDSRQDFDAAERFCRLGGAALRVGAYTYAE